MRRSTALLVGALALGTVLAGCGGSQAPQTTPSVSPTTVKAAAPPAPVPAPAGKPVLTLGGAVTNHNRGDEVLFDRKTLDAMATVTTPMYEPFLKRQMTFTGVPMADLLARAGVASAATKVRFHALDDYVVELKVSDLADRRVLLATKADGAAIPVSKGGPVRLVFPADSVVGKNQDLWIWSIDTMTVS